MEALGYNITEILYSGNRNTIYRAEDKDKQSLILKVINNEYPSETDLIRFQREYNILEQFKGIDGIAEVIRLEKYENKLIMVFKDSKAESLESLISKNISLSIFYKIAKSAVSTLNIIHEKKFIHKDIKPSNILYNPKTNNVEIIDFSSCSEMETNFPQTSWKGKMDDNLAYISPEQTGRVNRLIDYRTDYYSLGATLYHLITGRPPFISPDTMDMIYSHIAKEPLPPNEIDSSIPEEISKIILKLLAKNPEERYLSAFGILYDLDWISANKSRNEKFVLGKKDFSVEFHIPQKIYGRETEIKSLVDTYYHMYENGIPALSVILGNPGLGKSALVKEIYKPITAGRGYFITGEYEQYAVNYPYSGLIKAFSILIQLFLTGTLEEINNWKGRILSQLGNNSRIVTDVIPELEFIIGEQPPVVYLEPQENSNRFHLILHSFIRIFCTLNHPLVLFLDDMQWADQASIQLIKNLLADQSLKYIYIILGYQTVGDNTNNPFFEMLDSLKKENIYQNILSLNELSSNDISQLLIDCFNSSKEEVQDLTAIILSKTAGNPFFISELLQELSREKKIYPDIENGKWKCDLEEIKNTKISKNIIDLLISKIQKLPMDSQLVLKNAAYIGSCFDLWTLGLTIDQPLQKIILTLKELVAQDFITPSENSKKSLSFISEDILNAKYAKQILFQFRHDRILQAAYELVEEKEKINLQLTIGRIQLKENFSDENLFDILNHLNAGSEKISDIDEKIKLIELNLKAAQKAKLSTAYESALQYLNHAYKFLLDFKNPWLEIYSLTLQVYKELADLYYLNVQFEKLEDCIAILLKNTDNLSEIAHAFRLLINYYTTIANYSKAMDSGREALRLFNINLPNQDFENYTNNEFDLINQHLRLHSVQSILDSKEMKDESKLLALGLLSTLMPPAYLYNSQLWVFLVLKSVNLLLTYGHSEYIYGFSCYGIILGSMYNDYKKGHEFGLLALKIAEKFHNKSEITKAANIMANYTLPFREHLKNAEQVNIKGLEAGKESGEFQHISYCLIFNTLNSFYLGKNLLTILNDIIPKHMLLCKQAKSSLGKDTINALRITLQGMTSDLEDKIESQMLSEEESIFLVEWKQNNNFFTIFIFYSLKITRYFIQGFFLDAYEIIKKTKEYLNYAIGLYSLSEMNFYESLVLCALSTTADLELKKEYINQVKSNQKQMNEWVKSCPENFQHKYLIVEAELARLSGKYWKASKLFDESIEDARTNEFLQDEAIANELYAKLYAEIHKTKIMRCYLLEAHYLYIRWGAFEKVKQLESKYFDLFPNAMRTYSLTDSRENNLGGANRLKENFSDVTKILDLNAVINASQALAEEIVIEKLLKKIMRILFENAGAEKGLFIKYHNDEYIILAKGNSSDKEIEIFDSITPVEMVTVNSDIAATSIIYYVGRVKKHMVIENAIKEELFINDEYLRKNNPKSILCYPVIRHENLIGIIYLENNFTTHAFTKERLEVLNILSTQIAISIENSELYANLEAKVEERTANLNKALQQVKTLKEKQDGDYFLTSLLIHPLGKNNIQNDTVQIDFLIEQKKKFLFKNKEVEIGGDLCTTDRIFINHRTYIVVLNADAMGKSIQGAGGILVLGSVFKSILHRTQGGILENNIHPEKWIKNSFLEMQRIFESFDGYMLISLVLGLLDEENGVFYYINVEHPTIVLYRNKKASFIEKEDHKFRKMGVQGINSPIRISLFQMTYGDVLIIGSDGRDDIILGKDELGLDILNFDEELFLDSVEEGNGFLKGIYNSIKAKGALNDDLSLLRLSFKEFENKTELEIEQENQTLESTINNIKKDIAGYKEKKEFKLLIKSYEELILLQPLDIELLIQFSVIILKTKDYQKFIEYAEIIKLRSPENIHNILRLILSHIRLKNFQRASSLINEIRSLYEDNKRVNSLEQIVSDLIIKSF